MSNELTCEICFEPYSGQPPAGQGVSDRRPCLLCPTGHTFCFDCCSQLARSTCPNCREPVLPKPIVNFALLKVVGTSNEALSAIPEIPFSEMKIDEKAIAMGSYADVVLGKWNHQPVAVKKLRIQAQSDTMKSLKYETSIAMSLFHPNIVRIFGMVRMPDGMLGIVMEPANRRSLRDQMGKFSHAEKVTVSLGMCDGTSYLHSKKIAHRDLKPENILIFGRGEPVAKISDFGTSKVIQTLVTNTSQAGTPKYAAPELLDEGPQYGWSVDVYSLAIIFYELFSGLDPFPGLTTIVQVVRALLKNQRPKFPTNFHDELKEVVQRGWAQDPKDRPEISAFQKVFSKMDERQLEVSDMTIQNTTFRFSEQTTEVGLASVPLPLISMQWDGAFEIENSLSLKKLMVDNVKTKSNFKNTIVPSVLKAMEVVPRHLFMDPNRVAGNQSQKLEAVYTYNKAMGATECSNESSPEIVGVQLSLVKISTGARILLVGGKGGYINSLVAQVVGIHGQVTTVSSNQKILDTCKQRVDKSSPLSKIMFWKMIENVSDPEKILEAFPGRQKFHAIIYCGSVPSLPSALGKLIEEGGSLIAPVQIGENTQQFQLIIQESASKREIRKITEFGVIFEKVQ